MLSFIDLLKQTVADVHNSGGAIIERSKPTPAILQQLRQYALKQIEERRTEYWVIDDWFTEGYLDEHIRVSWIHLRKIGVHDDDLILNVLTQVIDSALSPDTKFRIDRDMSFDKQLASSLALIWDQMGDEQTLAYTFAQERSLINWDYLRSLWIVTGLGKLFLELSPLQASVFLLSIDSIVSTGVRDFRHIATAVLNSLLNPSEELNDILPLLPLHRDILYRLGIVKETNRWDSDYHELTPIGKIALRRVLDKDNPLKDVAALLIENEELGDAYRGLREETEQILRIIVQTQLLTDVDREVIRTSVQLYQSGKYVESLRILYPSIETIINNMLLSAGQQPGSFRGLAGKTQWLDQNGHIPPDVSQAIEIFTTRNRVSHGNFSAPEDYFFPVCLMAFRYLRRLLLAYKP